MTQVTSRPGKDLRRRVVVAVTTKGKENQPMNDQTTTIDERDEHLRAEASMLRHRAESLREQAGTLDDVLSLTYRRRASELELEAWLLEVHAGAKADEALPAA